MTRFSALRYEDLAVGLLETVSHRLTADMVSRWRALVGYRPGATAPGSLALTWLLEALRRALGGVPAGGVLMRHQVLLADRPTVGKELSTRVAIAELVTRPDRQVVIFQLDSAVHGHDVVTNRMHLIWPQANGTALRPGGRSPAPSEPQEVLLHAALTQEDIDAYAELSGDYNPLHVDPEAARRSPFGSTIAHGPLPLGLVQRAIEERIGSEWPSGLRLDARFLGPTRPGDSIAVHLTGEGTYQLVDVSGRLLIDVRTLRED